MSWVAVGVGGASLALGAYSSMQGRDAAGKEAEMQRRSGAVRKQAAELEATTLEQQASNSIGSAQRDMLDLQRQSRLAQSRTIALAAASGGGASSAPTVGKLVGDLAKEGSYNAARALYAGEERGRLMRLQAKELRTMGEFAVVGGNISGSVVEGRAKANELANAGTFVSNAGGLYSKYGGRGPSGAGPGATGTATPASEFTYTGLDSAGGPAYG